MRRSGLVLLWFVSVLIGMVIGEGLDRAYYFQLVRGGVGGIGEDGLVAAGGVSFLYRPLLAALSSVVILIGLGSLRPGTTRVWVSKALTFIILAAIVSGLGSIVYAIAEWSAGGFLP